MAQYHLIDELHVQIWIPRDMAPNNLSAVRRHLRSSAFRRNALRAIRSLFAGRKCSNTVRIRLAR